MLAELHDLVIQREELDIQIAERRKQLKKATKAYAKRVVNGHHLLQDLVPGWTREDKIDISTLELSDGTQCVLGQLAAKSALTSAGFQLDYDEDEGETPSYEHALVALDIEPYEYGFNTDSTVDYKVGITDTEGYFLLNHLWSEVILRIRLGKPVTVKNLVKSVLV